ncbi:cationic amino acid transporter 4 [Sitophilus oryzae]|uniref:Cationic amino acid transporter 4 n=1 Tax=Sitophilus oryzae TaxID=7048 RepID=A0A6J2Y6Z2_SITOR|nr:cationic amino acid transporter 4 [Sitophilus oryzae]XP_030758735.1 cationic amino acid transporter 4 [Sitophilus oryzae]XP_030758736.1 cationic amino acid transporter 4 [Sitophilus oryzae]
MPGSRKMILKHVMSGICTKMNRTKQLPSDVMETPLNRCLNTFDITLLGVGHMVGAGIYVLTGTVAKDIAGPGIILSFLLAGLASLLSALCYAEFGTRVPKAGSAYVYTYISIGEFWAFVIGWNILLEHMIGAASVARAWSGYVDSLFAGVISNTTMSITGELHEQLLGRYPDFLAFTVCLVYAFLLGIGVKGSAMVNSFLTIINLTVMAIVIFVGFYYANEENWTGKGGFLPYGFGGVVAGAATCFYAFVGFDSIATSGEEAKNPSFSIPMATVVSMGIVTLGYVLVSAALTLVIPYYSINTSAALPEAFVNVGQHWVKYVVSLGAICGMTTTLFGSLFSLPRCMYAMAVDGLLFGFLGNINCKTQLPLTNLIISGLSSALIALLFDLEKLVEFMSIGTLLAYTIVSASVIILRYRPTFETTACKPISTPASEVSASTSELTTPASEIINLTGTLRVQYSWLAPIFGSCEPGAVVTGSVFIYTLFCCALCTFFQISRTDLENGIWWTVILATFFILVMAGCVLVICAHHQNTTSLRFKVPMVPFIPALSILFNIEFMVHLNILTWLRFFIWMVIGMLVYFLYGIHHSKEGEGTSSYSILMTSSEAVKEKWGSTTRTNIKGLLTHRKASTGDKKTIVNEDEEDITE